MYSDRQRLLTSSPPTEEQLAYNGEPSLKAARVLGERKLATKSAAGIEIFGEDEISDEEAVKRANIELIEDRRRRRIEASSKIDKSLGKPTQEQLSYPTAAKRRPVSIKAMEIFGDEDLEKEAKEVIPNEGKSPSVKALKVLGSASSLAPLKARKVLGSSDSDGEARALADKHWIEEMTKRTEIFTREVLMKKPDEFLLSIPNGNGPVAEKALSFFGDDGLKNQSLRALKTRAPPKAIKVLGESSLAGSKAEELTGAKSEEYLRAKRQQQLQNIALTERQNAGLINYRNLFRYVVGDT